MTDPKAQLVELLRRNDAQRRSIAILKADAELVRARLDETQQDLDSLRSAIVLLIADIERGSA